MNSERRKAIEALKSQLDEIGGDIEALKDEEQDYYDNMPESFQGGDKGDTAQTAIDALESAASSIDEAITSLEESAQ